MKISHLIRHSELMEATKCGIFNALMKFRPELKDEMDTIPGLDVEASVLFLKDKGIWDEHAQKLLDSFLMWWSEYQSGPDEETAKKQTQRRDQLMCYVAKLIRQSAVSTDR